MRMGLKSLSSAGNIKITPPTQRKINLCYVYKKKKISVFNAAFCTEMFDVQELSSVNYSG